jgi:hypothetical protein
LPKEPAFAPDTVIAAPMADAANRSRLENMVVLLTIDSSESSKLGPVALGGVMADEFEVAIRLDIVDSRDEIDARRDQACAKEQYE